MPASRLLITECQGQGLTAGDAFGPRHAAKATTPFVSLSRPYYDQPTCKEAQR